MKQLSMKSTHKAADGKCIEGVGVGCKLNGIGCVIIAADAQDIAKIGAFLGKSVKDADVKQVAVFMARDCR